MNPRVLLAEMGHHDSRERDAAQRVDEPNALAHGSIMHYSPRSACIGSTDDARYLRDVGG